MQEVRLGACGLLCEGCPAYEATRDNDAAKIAETARLWSARYGADIRPEHVWCEGCMTDGRKCAHCADCEFRHCALTRELASCADCDDYACDRLAGFLAQVPEARAQLEARRLATRG